MPNPFESGQVSGEINAKPKPETPPPPPAEKVIVGGGLSAETTAPPEISEAEWREREAEAARLLAEGFEMNQPVRIRGEESQWYFFGEKDGVAMVGTSPDMGKRQEIRRVKIEDLEKAEE